MRSSGLPELTSTPPVTPSRRRFFNAAAAACAGMALPSGDAAAEAGPLAEVIGTAHWTVKRAGADNVKLFMWRKQLKNRAAAASDKQSGTILFVHGSSVSATPVFDLQVPGKPEPSTMAWFARRGYDTWGVACAGYGRADKSRRVTPAVYGGPEGPAVP